MAKKRKAPWKKSIPHQRAGKSSEHLSAAQKARAKRAAKKAGRPYPNLVDNMRVAGKTKKIAKRKTAKRKTAKRKSP